MRELLLCMALSLVVVFSSNNSYAQAVDNEGYELDLYGERIIPDDEKNNTVEPAVVLEPEYNENLNKGERFIEFDIKADDESFLKSLKNIIDERNEDAIIMLVNEYKDDVSLPKEKRIAAAEKALKDLENKEAEITAKVINKYDTIRARLLDMSYKLKEERNKTEKTRENMKLVGDGIKIVNYKEDDAFSSFRKYSETYKEMYKNKIRELKGN